jgi:hypothetical protein
MENTSVVKPTKGEKSTELTVTLAELDVASDGMEMLSSHYYALEQDLLKAETPLLLKDLRMNQKILRGFERKIQAAQKWLVRDEFK